jgi:hypothetical protein
MRTLHAARHYAAACQEAIAVFVQLGNHLRNIQIIAGVSESGPDQIAALIAVNKVSIGMLSERLADAKAEITSFEGARTTTRNGSAFLMAPNLAADART